MVHNLSSFIGTITRWSLKVIVVFLLFFFLTPLILRVVGYQVDVSGGILGRKAAEEQDVTMCNKIIVFWTILGPPSAERRASCVIRYAEETKDPSVCASLMPTQYGWSCLGGATDHDPCVFLMDSTVKGNGLVTTQEECMSGPDDIRNNECCITARIAMQKSDETCDLITRRADIKDQCFYEYSKNMKDLSLCAQVQNENLRTACEVAVRALQ